MASSDSNASSEPGKIALFYGSSTCYTEIAAEKIAATLATQQGGQQQVDIFNIANTAIARAEHYQQIIFGIPTWDYGELQEDWENIWDSIDTVNWVGKTVAIYGLGDQEGYPEWFQDALGYLWTKLDSLGATTIGQTSAAGYQFIASKALSPDGSFFLGLALDEDSEFERSEQRIADWCRQIAEEFKTA
ncbi:MAG: flavodoxin FldB [Gammaproteobacteria bacterium]|nr:flavodoxin FldB [Gammaproteobacteria bacterium]MBQ0840416.1 flavodoxin FldB [Gammaproteobacteria bacterium]